MARPLILRREGPPGQFDHAHHDLHDGVVPFGLRCEHVVDGEVLNGDPAVFRFVVPNANVASEWTFAALRDGGRTLDASLRGAGVNGIATGALSCETDTD